MVKGKLFSIGVIVILAGIIFVFRLNLGKTAILPKNENLKFEMEVKREPRIYDATQLVFGGDLRIYAPLYPKYHVGDVLVIEGFIDEQGRVFDADIEKIAEKNLLGKFFSSVRNKIAGNIKQLLPAREATLLQGMVLGVDEIDPHFREQLIKTGTIHAVVVSGQNLMIIAGVFLSLVKVVGRRASLVLAVISVFIYALLTGFEPPVVRASLMVLASTAAIFFGRQQVPILNLLVAAGLILLVWPQAILEVSFQLTFAATLGIMTLGQKLSRISNSKFIIFNLFRQNAAIATSAFIFTAPVILFYFGRISPLSPFVNILVAESIFPIMILGFAAAAASLIFLPLAQLFAYLAYPAAYFFSKVVDLFSKVPIAQIELEKGNLLVFALLVFLVIFLVMIWTREGRNDRL